MSTKSTPTTFTDFDGDTIEVSAHAGLVIIEATAAELGPYTEEPQERVVSGYTPEEARAIARAILTRADELEAQA